MAMAKQLAFFIGLTFLIFAQQGCAPMAVLAVTEGVGAHVTGGVQATGKQLREGADFSASNLKHLKFKGVLDYADWSCYSGKGDYTGQELCLLPHEAKIFNNKSKFDCRTGSGGKAMQMYNRDFHILYCTLQTA